MYEMQGSVFTKLDGTGLCAMFGMKVRDSGSQANPPLEQAAGSLSLGVAAHGLQVKQQNLTI